MEEAVNTERLRNLAPHWNLAGDKKLLSLLQHTHQKIMTRCQETSTKLEEMAIILDGANIDLQNVNNKFMALSNSQFIESRVYDDDLEVSVEEKPIKTENAAASNQDMELELAKLKQSLTVLESMHESVRILDSDSDSDSDEGDGRMVYRPKDLYTERPLPHIIGSQAWKSKWHGGIIAEDSDTDSTTSKPENEVLEQYSESESELTDTRTDRLNPLQRRISSNSSAAESEPSAAPLSQAGVAAELARKLAANLPQIPVETPELEPEYVKPRVASQVYKPQNPPTSNIFFDEPPPIDQSYQSDSNDYNDEEDDDIFAELHKTKPSFTDNKDQTRMNQDLFADFNNTPDITADLFGTEKKETTVQRNNEEHSKENDKKPVGGISVFGSSKGTESIGAAILKRNQFKTYSSDEENEGFINKKQNAKDTNKEQLDKNISTSKYIPKVDKDTLGTTYVNKDEPTSENNTADKKEKDILKDIFDKSKPNKNKNVEQVSAKEKTEDLFSDNLFDDIDDIFTDTIVKVPIKEASKDVKSIFDDDDDDLFADIAVTSQKETTSKSVDNKAGGLFDSDNDDDLFSEDPRKSEIIQKPENNLSKAKIVTSKKNKATKSIFDDDSDEDLFSDIKIKNSPSKDINKESTLESAYKEETDLVMSDENKEEGKDDDNNNLFSDTNVVINKTVPQYSTSIREITVNKAKEHVHNIIDSDKLNYSSQKGQEVSFILQAEMSIETSKLSSDFEENETDRDSSNHTEDTVKDDRNDSFTDSKFENVHKPWEDTKSKNNDNIGTESSTAHETQSENFDKSDLNNDMLSSNTSLPKENNSETEGSCESQSISYDSENLRLPLEPIVAAHQKPDIFNDIFNDVPPVFEKPKEPKKSKNVNALFDDDSDDEALFFKKNDIISDEKPDLSSVSNEDNLFRIFSDEPPAIDVDFTQKITQIRKSEIEDSKQFESLVHEDPIETLTGNEISNNNRQIPSQTESQINEKSTDKFDNNESKKSVGKLKMNINIDVNTLLPGASPKKNKIVEQVDGQVVSSGNLNKTDAENSEPNIVKSVSFESEVDSELLDNKLSKDRAKIQVKRRPSTRRARREAVKKSGIDFVNNDVTDNTSGDHSKALSDKEAMDGTVREIVKDSTTKDEKDNEQNIKSKIVYILNDEDIFSTTNTKKNPAYIVEAAVSNNNQNSKQHKTDATTFDDDDDIFKKINTAKVDKTLEASLTEKNQNQKNISTGKSDDVFDNRVDKENQNVTMKSENNSKKSTKNKASIFDDLSDDETELFQGKKSNQLKSEINPKKKNIFGSDSEEELFANNVKKPAVPKEDIPKPTSSKVVVKKSLFGDDSDEDLFSGKTSSSGSKPVFSKANEVKAIQTQSVDEDPLSLLSSDEVNYI